MTFIHPTSFHFEQGEVLLFNKPIHWTSFQLVNKVKWLLKKKLNINTKVGHAGTLDPLATGLLIICTGKQTKKIEDYQNLKKTYSGRFFLGATTPSYDLETAVNEVFSIDHISTGVIQETAKSFLGKSQQIAPLFSAKKINGERAYNIARRGDFAEIKPREVTITKFEITQIALPEISFVIECSKGTYIRSIANDFGQKLRSGAYLSALRREGIGDFSVQNAFEIDDFEKAIMRSIEKTEDTKT